jgi:ABC-type multidrug transport system ATPase subunit
MLFRDCKTELSIEDALRIVGLEEKINKKVYTLSGGEFMNKINKKRILIIQEI